MNEPQPGDREGWAVYADWLIAQGRFVTLGPASVAILDGLTSGRTTRHAEPSQRLVDARLCTVDAKGRLALTDRGRQWADAAGVGWVGWRYGRDGSAVRWDARWGV